MPNIVHENVVVYKNRRTPRNFILADINGKGEIENIYQEQKISTKI